MDQEALDVNILDRSPLFAQIVQHARTATGAVVVVLTTWSPKTGEIRTRASSGYGDSIAQKALQAIRRIFPKFVPERVVTNVHVNPIQEVIYLEGQAVTAPFKTVAAGVAPDAVLSIASRFLDLNYSTVEPLRVGGKVVGSLSFHGAALPSEAAIAAFEAFAQQVALTLENAMLLHDMQEQFEELKEARRLVTASNEAVRREIAERLHGPVQTQLVVADFTLRRASGLVDGAPDEARTAIADARALIDSVRNKEIREVSHILHPCVVGLGLAPAIRSLVDRFRPTMEVDLDVHPDLDGVGAIAAVEIGDATRLAAYRVVEEALANAYRHGHASRVTVSLTTSRDEEVLVSVSDDGVGFSESMEPGLGLRVIALKVEEVRGTWAIGRSSSGGAMVTAALPFRGGSSVGELHLAYASR